MAEFSRHFRITFRDPGLLRLALTHRSYLSVTGMGPRESNERLEFLGDSVLGLVTSESLYRHHPEEHEGQLTKTKSLLVSKAILSRRALHIGLGRFILMSNSEVDSGGRKRPSILADAFEAVLGAIYLDQGFEAARRFVEAHLLRGSQEIVADKRHRNYKSQLQEYVQSTFHTHPVYRIRSQMGPDHSKLFQVEVMVGRRVLGEGRGANKKEAEQAAARDAMEQATEPGGRRGEERGRRPMRGPLPAQAPPAVEEASEQGGREGRRGERGRRRRGRARPDAAPAGPAAGLAEPLPVEPDEIEPTPEILEEDDVEEVGRPEGPPGRWDEDEFEATSPGEPVAEPAGPGGPGGGETHFYEEDDPESSRAPEEGEERGWLDGEAREEDSDEAVPGEREDADAGPVEPGPDATPRFGRRRMRRR